MALVQNWPFFYLSFFLSNRDLKNVFYYFLEREIAFLGYKNKKFKSKKIYIFPKGLVHSFGPKLAIFSPCFFRKDSAEKCVL